MIDTEQLEDHMEDDESKLDTWDYFLNKRMIGHIKVQLKKDERKVAVFEGGEALDPETGRTIAIDDLRELIAITKKKKVEVLEKMKRQISRLDAMDARIHDELSVLTRAGGPK